MEISGAWRPAEDHGGNSRSDSALAQENSDWGAPKIHGELQKLGFLLSERTVARYLRRIQHRGDPAKRWLAFLRNHREAIVALDLFTVPTDFPGVVLFVRHRARTPQDPALQRYAAPVGRLGRAAVARNLCGGGSVSLHHSGSRFDPMLLRS
jgi:hypothetical protein